MTGVAATTWFRWQIVAQACGTLIHPAKSLSLLLLRRDRRRPQWVWHTVLPCLCLRHLPLPRSWSHRHPTIIALSIAASPSSASARAHAPAPDILPRALPSATALTRSASCPRPRQPPDACPCPRPRPCDARGHNAPSPRRSQRARYPWKARRDEFQGALARGRAGTAGAASPAPAMVRVRETGPWRHRPRAPALAAARHQGPTRAAPDHIPGGGTLPHRPPGASGRGPHTTAWARHAALPAGRTRPLATMAAPAPSGSLR